MTGSPGDTQFVRMPYCARSSASARVMPARPCFTTGPCTRFFAPESAIMPPSVTMAPPPALIISGTHALAQKIKI